MMTSVIILLILSLFGNVRAQVPAYSILIQFILIACVAYVHQPDGSIKLCSPVLLYMMRRTSANPFPPGRPQSRQQRRYFGQIPVATANRRRIAKHTRLPRPGEVH